MDGFKGAKVRKIVWVWSGDGIEPPTREKKTIYERLRSLVMSCKLSFPPVKPDTVLTGRPMGSIEFVQKLERLISRALLLRKGGWPKGKKRK